MNIVCRYNPNPQSKLATVFSAKKDLRDHFGGDYLNHRHWPILRVGLYPSDRVDDVHAIHNFPKGGMHLVQIVVVYEVDEELASARVRSGIRHGNRSAIVLVVVGELVLYIVAWTAGSSSSGVSSLDHEPIDHPVEDRPIVEPLLDQRLEVASCDGHVVVKLNGDIPHICVQQYFGRPCPRSIFCHTDTYEDPQYQDTGR